MKAIQRQMEELFGEFLERGQFKKGEIVVIGCSTSEVLGANIGKGGSGDVAKALFDAIYPQAAAKGVYVAFQCCEHLNRALVISREALEYYHLEEVSAVPYPHAGGAMASYAYRHLPSSCLCESIKAHGGIDIGETMIGMHLKAVAVPMRLKSRTIGQARINAAYTRMKLIGGERAKYTLEDDQC